MNTLRPQLAPDPVPNRFLRSDDWEDPRYVELRHAFEDLYARELGGRPHPFGSQRPDEVLIHWSREWEYPWAVLNAELQPGHRVVDLGCGGSPLLMFLHRAYDCRGVGVDPMLKPGSHYDLRTFPDEPTALFPEIDWRAESMESVGLEDGSVDRIFCISVLEHVRPEVAQRTFADMRRLLRPGGLVLITTDVCGDHRTLTIDYRELLEMAREVGLELRGAADFSPAVNTRGTYDVVGFRLGHAGGQS